MMDLKKIIVFENPCMNRGEWGREKSAGEGGEFFHLFDWRRKSHSSWNHSKTKSDNLPTSSKVDEDDIVLPRSFKGGRDCSFSSSVSDEDFGATRIPGVLARLMGLDS